MKIKQLLCTHKNNNVVCWHWTHGANGNENRFIEIQLKCNKCGRYYFRYIKNYKKCLEFEKYYKEKKWSNKYKPVFKKR